jgi:HAD superfamily phosphatase (TIGR01668 family)
VNFRTGKFDRTKIAPMWRGFCPMEAVESLTDVDLQALADRGKRLILVDVDNTLLPWRSEDIPESTFHWLEHAKKLGFDVCILSNTRHRERLKRLSEKMGIDYLLGRFKPSRRMYLAALQKYKREPAEAVMIGDQLVTDILGANRSGIEAIWVKQMTERDLITTKINRAFERFLRGFFYRTLPVETILEDGVAKTAGVSLVERPIVRQFAKFVIIGAMSFVIDAGLHYLLMFVVPVHGEPLGTALGGWLVQNYPQIFGSPPRVSDAAFPVLKVFSATISIFNGFFWNRRWTFKIRGREDRFKHLVKFFTVALIGLILNTVIASGLNNVVPGHARWSWAVGTAVATVVVAFWNFTGHRLWTFRQKTS